MIRIEFPDLFSLRAISGGSQIAVIGESSAEKGMAVHIIRAYLQAKAAFQAFCRGALMCVISIFGRLIFPDTYICLLQVLMDG